jgi:sugar phosphate isomerase/epimerase
MRFGIAEMSGMRLARQLRDSTSAEDLMSAVTGFDRVESIRELAGHGFDPIELGGDLTLFFPGAFDPDIIDGLAALRAKLGISYTVHLPLWSVEPSTPLQRVRRGSVQAIVDTILATTPLEPEIYVMHATNALAAEFSRLPIAKEGLPLLLGFFQEQAAESLREIIAETGMPSRQLAIETVEFPFEMTLELAEELDVSMCLDTGHVLVGFSGPVDLYDAVEQCLPRLGEIHLHDGPWQGPERSIGYGKDHQPLGKGDLDVEKLLDRLAEADYQGPVVFELPVDASLASLDLIRSLRPEAVTANV